MCVENIVGLLRISIRFQLSFVNITTLHGRNFGLSVPETCKNTSVALQGVFPLIRLNRLHTLINTYSEQSSFMVAIERCTVMQETNFHSQSHCMGLIWLNMSDTPNDSLKRNDFMTIEKVESFYFNTLSFIRSLGEQESLISICAFHP